MPDKAKFNRREFLMATAKTGSGLAPLGGIGFLELPPEAKADQKPGSYFTTLRNTIMRQAV
jgi:hypothetical protein